MTSKSTTARTGPRREGGRERPSAPSVWIALPLLCLVIATGFQAWIMTLDMRTFVSVASVDDSFLYLQVARNWAATGVPSFDGVTKTNGIQPLWGWVMRCMAEVGWTSEHYVRAMGWVCVWLNMATSGILLLMGIKLGRTVAGSVASILFSCYMLTPNSISLMECNLHGFVFCGIIWSAVFLWMRPIQDWKIAQIGLLGILLTLNGLSRLDSGLFSLAIWIVFVFQLVKIRRWNAAAILSLPALLIAIPYFTLNYWEFGSAVPISGTAKFVWAYQVGEAPWSRHVMVWAYSVGQILTASIVKSTGLSGLRATLPVALIAMGFVILFASAVFRKRLPNGILFLWCFHGLHLIMMAMILRQFSISYWYYQPLRITIMMTVGLVVANAVRESPRGSLVFGIGLLMCLAISLRDGIQLTRTVDHPYAQRYDAAIWIRDSGVLARGARIGAWNAGQLGYFSRPQTVVNLDGLVQDRKFLDQVIVGRNWKTYLKENSIQYLVDHDVAPPGLKNFDHSKSSREYYRGLVPRNKAHVLREFGRIQVLDVREWLEDP